MLGTTYYHSLIRKSIVAFGNLFSNIKIERKLKDGSNTTVQTIKVPIAYAPKEKWLVRVEQDPNLDNHTYTVLPRMSFEMTAMNYDSARKLNRMNKLRTPPVDGVINTQFTPVPYNVNISLYILTKTQEDALQIVEQILPTFTPEYTVAINTVPEMEIVTDIPIILNSVSIQDDYDGDFQTRRSVVYTLDFTLKLNLFGPVSPQGDIRRVLVDTTNERRQYDASVSSSATPDEFDVTESWTDEF